jgi:hypothetical protein
MNPARFSQMMKYLTRAKKEKPDLPDVFPASKAPIPAKTQNVEEIEAINRFMKANPRKDMAGGGMLVQPGFGGVRQGYREPVNQIKAREYLENLPKNSDVVVLDIAKELEIDRGAIDKVIKEKKFKNKNFKILRKAGFITNENFAKEYKNYQKSDAFITGEDKEFAKYLNDKGLKAETKSGEHTSSSINSRRKRLDIKSASVTQPRLTDKEILKEAKKFKINTKGLSAEEIREKVITKRTKENLLKKRAADPELDERLREEAIERANKRRQRLLSTEEGRALLKAQQRKQKATKYLKEGLDPPANSAKEMLWKDTVKTAKEKSRFNIVSGYKKSMKKDDYYSNKIKIKDSLTGKTFTFNTIENFINKNAGSFNIKNFEEVIKPYKQKQFINDKGLRNILNEALIPNYNPGNPANAFTIQHDFGRNNNPFKVSLAFYDENTKEYKIRSDFERAWEKSKKSKTPLTDRKKAFNIFKESISELDAQSAPSMITRDRFFGKGLDLTKAIRAGKEAGAKIPRGIFKEALEFDKQIINQIAVLGGGNCGRAFKNQGGRIGLQEGTPNVDACFKNAVNRINQGLPNATPAEARNFTKVLKLGRNILKFGIIPEALFIGAESLFRVGLGDKPGEALLRASEYILPGNQTDVAEVMKVARTKGPENAAIVERALKYKSELGNIENLEAQKQSAEILSPTSEFDYLPDRTQDIKNIEQRILDQKQNLTKINEAQLKGSERIQDEAYDIAQATSPITKLKAFSKDIELPKDDPLSIDLQSPVRKIGTPLFRSFRADMEQANIPESTVRRYFKENPQDGNAEDFINYQKDLKNQTLNQAEQTYNPEELYGASGLFFGQPLAGGGIAKLAGIDQGPPPVKGPNSQGLQGLMKRVRNY